MFLEVLPWNIHCCLALVNKNLRQNYGSRSVGFAVTRISVVVFKVILSILLKSLHIEDVLALVRYLFPLRIFINDEVILLIPQDINNLLHILWVLKSFNDTFLWKHHTSYFLQAFDSRLFLSILTLKEESFLLVFLPLDLLLPFFNERLTQFEVKRLLFEEIFRMNFLILDLSSLKHKFCFIYFLYFTTGRLRCYLW